MLIGRGAVAAEHEFDDIGWDRELSAELPHQILAHRQPDKDVGGEAIEGVELHGLLLLFPPTCVGRLTTTLPSASVSTSSAGMPASVSSGTSRLVRPSAASGSTTRSATMLSCGLKPPWAYSRPARNACLPGAEVTITAGFQLHGSCGTDAGAPSLTIAQRVHLVSVSPVSSFATGSPPGSSNHP
jgi:hypothetical protein